MLYIGSMTKEAWIKSKALELGFDHVGIALVGRMESENYLNQWIARGFHADMQWMENNREKRMDPRLLMPGAKSIICVGLNYFYPIAWEEDKPKISRYALGDDYHEVLKKKLKSLESEIQTKFGGVPCKACVDTAPIMDKYWAVKAGIGWQGKHSNVITRDKGSWIFLGELITDLELVPDEPIGDFCGSCSLCIDACPTNAIAEPYVIDSNKCISYQTIEFRGDLLPNDTAGWIYGCDICQDVCPWNTKFSAESQTVEFKPREALVNRDLSEWKSLTEENYREKFKKSAVKRAKYKGLKRNIDHL